MKKGKKTKQISVRLESEVYEDFKRHCHFAYTTMTFQVTDMITKYVEKANALERRKKK